MSTYPPGMTKSDWQHIDGEQHRPQCPYHEDYAHRCDHLRPGQKTPSVPSGADFCPWCGQELVSEDCICDEIDEAEREEAIERKGTL